MSVYPRWRWEPVICNSHTNCHAANAFCQLAGLHYLLLPLVLLFRSSFYSASNAKPILSLLHLLTKSIYSQLYSQQTSNMSTIILKLNRWGTLKKSMATVFSHTTRQFHSHCQHKCTHPATTNVFACTHKKIYIQRTYLGSRIRRVWCARSFHIYELKVVDIVLLLLLLLCYIGNVAHRALLNLKSDSSVFFCCVVSSSSAFSFFIKSRPILWENYTCHFSHYFVRLLSNRI